MLRKGVIAVVVLAILLSCFQLHSSTRELGSVKANRMELSHIKYGLFNVDAWKQVIAGIITKKVNEFELTPESRPELKRKIEGLLEKLVAEIELVLDDQNRKKGIKGFLRGVAMDVFDVVDDVKRGIPEYAEVILNYVEDPDNREDIRRYLIQRFNEFADNTAGEVDYQVYNDIISQYGAVDKPDCLGKLAEREASLQQVNRVWTTVLLVALLALMLFMLIGARTSVSELYFMVAACFALLLAGITLPMIDIEATISSFSFLLVGESVQFVDQVLFFQSKSIGEVVVLLFERGELPLIGVACLIFAFSVFIPALKLVYSVITLYRRRKPRSGFGNFLVFKSSKWSMADVMVVAIFMSYIGFNGVINSELTQVKNLTGNVEVFTTNNSTLMIGFYLFTAYCLVGLLLATAIEKKLDAVRSPAQSSQS